MRKTPRTSSRNIFPFYSNKRSAFNLRIEQKLTGLKTCTYSCKCLSVICRPDLWNKTQQTTKVNLNVQFINRAFNVVCESWWGKCPLCHFLQWEYEAAVISFSLCWKFRVDICWFYQRWALNGGTAIGEDELLISLIRILVDELLMTSV